MEAMLLLLIDLLLLTDELSPGILQLNCVVIDLEHVSDPQIPKNYSDGNSYFANLNFL